MPFNMTPAEEEASIRIGLLSLNEVRAFHNLDPIEGGNVHFVLTPNGAVPVADLELYFKITSAQNESS